MPRQIGAIAQLGERLICIQEVVGSIPSGSTTSCWQPGFRQRKILAAVFGWFACSAYIVKRRFVRVFAIRFSLGRGDAVVRLSLPETTCLCCLTAHNRTDLVKIWSFPVSKRRASYRNKIAFGYLAMAIGNENDQVS